MRLATLAILLLLIQSQSACSTAEDHAIKSAMSVASISGFSIRVLDKKPQPRDHFVQGLEIHDGMLYVSTGNYGKSRLLRYRFEDMQLERGRNLHPRVFAEGLTVLKDTIYQLTWRNRALLVYNKSDFDALEQLPLLGEGWGLTNDGENLIYSDGSETLYTMAPATGHILKTVSVTENGRPLKNLNELEWIDGSIWANIWRTERIVIINPQTGVVTASINLKGLLPSAEYRPGTDVLNGIARNPANGDLWVTGKHWPWLYRIELVPIKGTAQARSTALE